MRRSKWSVVGFLLAAWVIGCDGAGDGSPGTGGAAGATASAGGQGGTTTSVTTVTTTTGVTSTASSGGAGGTGGADPACPEGSLYALSDTALDENVVSMCKYRGDVLLIVNVAEA